MVTSLTETSNETNKSFFTNVCVLLDIINNLALRFKLVMNCKNAYNEAGTYRNHRDTLNKTS